MYSHVLCADKKIVEW